MDREKACPLHAARCCFAQPSVQNLRNVFLAISMAFPQIFINFQSLPVIHKGFHSRPTKTPLEVAKDSTADPLRRPLRCPLRRPLRLPLRRLLPPPPFRPPFKTGRLRWGDRLTGVSVGVSMGVLVGTIVVGLLWNPLRSSHFQSFAVI